MATTETLLELMSEAEAAGALGVKVNTLRTWASRRRGPPRIKVGRAIHYRRSALLDWLASCEIDPERARRA